MTQLPLILVASLSCAGCTMPLTRATLAAERTDHRSIEALTWQRLPGERIEQIKTACDEGLARGLATLPAARAREYRRYWIANRSFIFTLAHLTPARDRAAEPGYAEVPRQVVLLALRCPGGVPRGGEGSTSADGTLRLLLGGDDMPEATPSGSWSLRFGAWPELTGPPGTLALWDPVRVQVEGSGPLLHPIFGTGLVIDQATWDRIVAAASITPATASCMDGASPLHSTGYATTVNPLRWLLVPGTLLLDAFIFGDDDGERHRTWASNRWNFSLER
jgi:hypothetical protein